MNNIETLRLQFPVTEQIVYLNHAAVAPLPACCKLQMERYLDELSRFGAFHYTGFVEKIVDRARVLGAEFLGTNPDNIFIVRSTTHGLGIAAEGIDYRKDANIVLVEGEFPANIRPWYAQRKKGVEIRFVKQNEGRVLIDDLKAAIDSNTAVVSVSWVQYASGFRICLGDVAELCKKVDALFVVDAIQGLGAFPINVEQEGIDFLSADSHKWLLGPEGVGLGYASPKARERIAPLIEGWLSVEDPFDFQRLNQPLKATAGRYEDGAMNFAGIHGMVGSLELLKSLGIRNVASRILELTDFLAEKLNALGLKILSPRNNPEEKSGILSVGGDFDPDELAESLTEARIFIAVRNNALRISPHCYNSFDELDDLIRIISTYLQIGKR